MNVLFELETGAIAPTKAHPEDAGWDLYLPVGILAEEAKDLTFNTGVHVLIPPGCVGLILPRSSLSAKGIHVITGVIDAGYTGPIKINMWREYWARPRFNQGDRVAQLVIVPLLSADLVPGKVIGVETSRGDGGFGSTGR